MTAYEPKHAADVRPATEDRWNTTMARLMHRVTEAVLTTDVALRLCDRCEKPITGTPIRDSEQIAWAPDSAGAWCSPDCLAADAQDYWESRWSA